MTTQFSSLFNIIKEKTVYCGCGNTIIDEGIEVCRECK